MLEIIALIFMCKKIGGIAEMKGYKPSTWKIYVVIAWILAELIGVFIGVAIFDNNIIPIILLGLGCAITSFIIIKSILQNKPDIMDDDINSIGTDYQNN